MAHYEEYSLMNAQYNYLIFLFLLLFCLASTNTYLIAQPKLNKENSMSLHVFDIKTFEKNKHGSEYAFLRSDGCFVRQIDLGDTYQEEVSKPYNPYSYNFVYNRKGILIATSTEFYGMNVGEYIEYNDHQQIIKTTNYDLPYPFSIENLAKMMESNFSINILDDRQTFKVTRYIDEKNTHKPLYEVHAYYNGDKNWFSSFLIDGNTGELLYQGKTFHAPIVDGIYVQYIKSTNEYQQGIYKLEDNNQN